MCKNNSKNHKKRVQLNNNNIEHSHFLQRCKGRNVIELIKNVDNLFRSSKLRIVGSYFNKAI